MRYTFLLYSNPADFAKVTPEDMAKSQQAFQKYIGDMQEAGVFIATDWLKPVETATTVSPAGVQDGPFAETKETLGGYFAVDVPDLDTAIDWAKKCPAAAYGKVEIRPSAFE